MNTFTAFLLGFTLCVPLCLAEIEIQERDITCGIKKVSRMPKIVNGTSAYHGQFPWAVSLRLQGRHHCGGALINHNWILTAAHCVSGVNFRAFSVKLGGHFRATEHEPNSIELQVTRAIAHEGFTFQNFQNDIALIKLSKSVEYNNYVWPVCLPAHNNANYTNTMGVVIGWGKLDPSTGKSATSLQQVELPILENDQCIRWYQSQLKSIPIRSTQFCAGLYEGGKDACQGDSGSPLMKMDQQSGQAMAIGIVSAGIGCALPRLPGLYTRIAAFIPWVKNVLTTYAQEKPIVPEEKPTIKPTLPESHTQKPIISIIHPIYPANNTRPLPDIHIQKPHEKPIISIIHPVYPPNNTRPLPPYPIISIPANNTTVIIHMPPIHNHSHNLTIQTQIIHKPKVTFAPNNTTPFPSLLNITKNEV